jgi:hypothetical protein
MRRRDVRVALETKIARAMPREEARLGRAMRPVARQAAPRESRCVRENVGSRLLRMAPHAHRPFAEKGSPPLLSVRVNSVARRARERPRAFAMRMRQRERRRLASVAMAAERDGRRLEERFQGGLGVPRSMAIQAGHAAARVGGSERRNLAHGRMAGCARGSWRYAPDVPLGRIADVRRRGPVARDAARLKKVLSAVGDCAPMRTAREGVGFLVVARGARFARFGLRLLAPDTFRCGERQRKAKHADRQSSHGRLHWKPTP